MKGSISRQSDRPDQRYSGVRHIQGGMLTDADLNEAATLTQGQNEAQAAAIVGSGVPAQGGMLLRDKENQLQIGNGTVFAEGKQGQFRLLDDKGPVTDLAAALEMQTDLQGETKLAELSLAYVDLWERPVFALQDPYLADPGLHGAETSFRTRTMVQLKTLPLDDMPDGSDAMAKLLQTEPFRRKGDATVTLKPKSGTIDTVDCDPCADQISVDVSPPNALFRLEVVDIQRNKQGKVSGIALAWSFENGEVIEPFIRAAAIKKDDHVYELFNEASETQIGYIDPDTFSPTRPSFTKSLATNKPGDVAYDYIRRWNGHAIVPFAASGKVRGATPNAASSDGTRIEVQTEFFTLELNFTNRHLVVGDYWQVEMRRYAPEAEQMTLNGGPSDVPSAPRGPDHHFCPLFFSKGTDIQPLPDAMHRQLSFPALIDIPASHVSYDADEDCPLMDGAETVQEALDAVCDIDASHVAFNPPAEVCPTLQDSENVHDALLKLCEADRQKQMRLMMRSMMDWGVICGVKIEQELNSVTITAGIVHDCTGVLHELDPLSFDVRKLDEGNLWDPKTSLDEIYKEHGEICLALAVGDAEPRVVLCAPTAAQAQDDLTLVQRIEACLKGKGSLSDNTFFDKIDDDDRRILTKIHVSFRNDLNPITGLGLTKVEHDRAREVMNILREDFDGRVGKHDQDRLSTALTNVEREAERSAEKLETDQGRLLFMGLAYATLMKLDDELRLDCLCQNAVPPCPDEFEGTTLVPVGCLEFDPETLNLGELILIRACMMCCRRQAQTWKSYRYYFGDTIGAMLGQFNDLCCEEPLNPDGNISLQVEDWFAERAPAPWDATQSTDMWPPTPTYLGDTPSFSTPVAGSDRGLAGWNKGRPPEILDIKELTIQRAQSRLKEAGFNLVESVHLESMDEAVKLSEARGPLLNRYPQKGDHVVLIHDGELAVEFVVIYQEPEKPFRFLPKLDLSDTRKIVPDIGIRPAPIDISEIKSGVTFTDRSDQLLRDAVVDSGITARTDLGKVAAAQKTSTATAQRLKTATPTEEAKAKEEPAQTKKTAAKTTTAKKTAAAKAKKTTRATTTARQKTAAKDVKPKT